MLLKSDKKEDGKVNWRKTQIFFGDERCVPLHHPDSNYDNISRRLLIHIPIPEENIHLIRCGSSLQKAASDYEKLLKRQLHARSNTAKNSTAGPIALFDITLLGLGEDGHTASLFPEATALSTTKNWVQPVIHQKPPPPIVNRVTLTPKAFNLSFQVVFLVSGKNKSPIIGKFLSSSPKQSATLPPHLIKPIHGDVFWFLDKAAAERL